MNCGSDCRISKKKTEHRDWEDNLFESFLQTLIPGSKKTQDVIFPEVDKEILSAYQRKMSQENVVILSHIAKEKLYIEVLYTIKHKIGSTSEGYSHFKEDLYDYAQKVFDISDRDHQSFLLAANEEKPPVVVLNVTVIQARDLEAKDADGLSDPYIMLGIVPGKVSEDIEHDLMELSEEIEVNHGLSISSNSGSTKDKSPRIGKCQKKKTVGCEKHLSMKMNSKDLSNKSKDYIPAKFIQSTSVKENTLNPVWNELFHFDIDNLHSDKLHLDIWDHDDEENVFDAVKRLNQVRGVKGLTRYFKQVGQSARNSDGDVDDFLGCLTVDLDNIPSIGMREWFTLDGRSCKSHAGGAIELDLKLSTREHRNLSVEGNWVDILQHEHLLKMFIKYELRCCQNVPKSWNGDIREEAETILHQHAIQGDITELQQLVCRWSAASEIFIAEEFNPIVIIDLLNKLEQCWKPGQLSRDEIDLLSTSYKSFIDHCLETIKLFRFKFSGCNEQNSRNLKYTLRMLAIISNSNVFKSVSPFENDVYSQLVIAIKSAASIFIEISFINIDRKIENSEMDVSKSWLKCLLLMKVINQDLSQLEDFYNDIFVKETKLKLFPLTYKIYNNEIQKLFFANNYVRELLSQFIGVTQDTESYTCYKSFLDLFSLHSSFEQFYSHQDVLITDDFQSFDSLDFLSWFLPIFKHWINFMKCKLQKNIEYQIDNDQLKTLVDHNLICSSSAVNVVNILETIEHIWRRMQWIDIENKMTCITQIISILGDCGLLYADTLHEKIRLAGYFDECGQFDLSNQLCIALNNIASIDLSISQFPIKMVFDTITTELIAYSGDKQTGKAFRDSLFLLIKDYRDRIYTVISNIVQRVTGKMRPEIRKNICHLCWSPRSVNINQASNDLLIYLLENIHVIKEQLHSSIFAKATLTIWNEVLSQFSEQAHKEFDENHKDTENDTFIFSKIYQCLDILLQKFAEIDDSITIEQFETNNFKNLKYVLLLYQLNTKEIIEYYFKEKQMEQDNAFSHGEYGYLNIRAFYQRNSSKLYVEVIGAYNLMPLDSNGLSDPFVMLEVAPDHLFDNIMKPQKTRVIKNTLNPEFNEIFEIPIKPEDIIKSSATLVLNVMDHDILKNDDFEGVVFVSLNKMPGIDDDITDILSVEPVNLPLLRPKSEVNKALSVLYQLKADGYAIDFVKKWMPLENSEI